MVEFVEVFLCIRLFFIYVSEYSEDVVLPHMNNFQNIFLAPFVAMETT